MEWKIYESPPGPPLMGFKGVSYMGCEITLNGEIRQKVLGGCWFLLLSVYPDTLAVPSE